MLIGRAVAPTAQMETFMVKAGNGDEETEFNSSLKHHTAKMLIEGRYTWAAKYFGSYVKGGEDITF